MIRESAFRHPRHFACNGYKNLRIPFLPLVSRSERKRKSLEVFQNNLFCSIERLLWSFTLFYDSWQLYSAQTRHVSKILRFVDVLDVMGICSYSLNLENAHAEKASSPWADHASMTSSKCHLQAAHCGYLVTWLWVCIFSLNSLTWINM